MQHNRLLLNELEETLQFWEDIVSIGTAQDVIAKTGNKEWQFNINSLGNFVSLAKIPEYRKLRESLHNKKPFGNKHFLPPVPAGAEKWLEQINYSRTGFMNLEAITMYPYMLSEWIKIKKVFRIEDYNNIPLMSPYEKNYLNCLPYDSFIMSFQESVEVGFETSSLIKRYKSFIVVRSGKLIDVFLIPDEIEPRSLGIRGRKLYKNAFQGNRINGKHLEEFIQCVRLRNIIDKPPFFNSLSFHIERPYIFFSQGKDPNGKVTNMYFDLYRKISGTVEEYDGEFIESDTHIPDTPQLRDSSNFYKFIFELVNGFCYAISEIQPRKNLITEMSKKTTGAELERSFSWNEIPITKIDYLETNDSELDPLKISYGSGEKSPHMRRGHWRNIIKRDGTSEKVWIHQAMVREDKLKNEELKGNVSIVKKKKEEG